MSEASPSTNSAKTEIIATIGVTTYHLHALATPALETPVWVPYRPLREGPPLWATNPLEHRGPNKVQSASFLQSPVIACLRVNIKRRLARAGIVVDPSESTATLGALLREVVRPPVDARP